jgi:hypothetical protein
VTCDARESKFLLVFTILWVYAKEHGTERKDGCVQTSDGEEKSISYRSHEGETLHAKISINPFQKTLEQLSKSGAPGPDQKGGHMRFIFIMQHTPTDIQVSEGKKLGDVFELNDKKLLLVPDDPSLQKVWFEEQAKKIEAVFGGFGPQDTVHAMGQGQLVNALNAAAVRAGAKIVESVTKRVSRDVPQPDGTIKKELIFDFCGFREVYQF